MQMGPKEIAVEYRTAANRQKQIKVLAQLNLCAERRIAEILAAEGEDLPKKWQEQLLKPARRSRKFPDGEATPEDDAPAPVETPSVTAASGGDSSLGEGAKRATDRDLFDAVATLLPEAAPVGADSIRPEPEETAEVPVAPGNEDEGYTPADDVGPEPETLRPKSEAAGDDIPGEVAEASLITREDVCLGACKNLLAALDLKPDEFHCYACGTLDLVFSLLGVPEVWQPIHDGGGLN